MGCLGEVDKVVVARFRMAFVCLLGFRGRCWKLEMTPNSDETNFEEALWQ